MAHILIVDDDKHMGEFIHIPKTGGNSIQSILSIYSEDILVRDDYHH